MTRAQFGWFTCLGLWLLDAKHGNLGSLCVVPNLAMTDVTALKSQ